MTTRRERVQRKKDEYFKEICKEFTKDLPISQAEKDRIETKCVGGVKALPPKDRFTNIIECDSETDNSKDFQKCLGFKALNKGEPFFKPKTPQEAEERATCETEAFKAPNKLLEQEFRSWCYADVNEEFKRGHEDQFIRNALATSERITTPSIPTEPAFHTPQQAVKKTDAEPEDQAQDTTPPPSSHTITITRKFRLKRVYKSQPVTKTMLKEDEWFIRKVFERFEKVTNRQIRAGVSLPDEVFKGKGGKAVKSFYNKVRGTPSMDAFWDWRAEQNLQLNERMLRCAAQHSYFALRDYKTRFHLLTHFTDSLQSLPDPSLILDSKFPQKKVFDAIYSNLPQLGMKLTKGQVSRVYLGNVLRWMRNLVKRGFRTKYGNVVTNTFNSQSTPPHLAYELARWLTRDMPKFLDSYLNILSRRLTGQVKRTLKKKASKRTLPKTKQRALIRRILKKHNLDMKTLDVESWGKARKKWRDETKEIFMEKFKEIDVATLATHAVREGQAGLTPERVLNLLFSFRPRRLKAGTGNLAGFKAYLVQRAVTELEYRRIYLLRPHLAPTVHQILVNLLAEPRVWLKLPHFQKQAIPFGQDDRRAYHDEKLTDLYILASHKQGIPLEAIIHNLLRKQLLKKGSEKYEKKVEEKRNYIEALIKYDKKNNWFEKVKKRKVPITLGLTLKKNKPILYTLETPKRFMDLVRAGYTPQKATLMKEKGGKLSLAIPFEKDVPKSQTLKRSDLTQIQDALIRAALDLGLKTWAVLSIGRGDKLVAGAWGEGGEEFARCFIDQKQLCEGRDEWFKPFNSKANPPDYKKDKFPNFKRRLANLRREAYDCQRERDAYRNKCRKQGIDYRHKQHFSDLNKTLKRIWQNMSHLHDELTRQIATRILAACEEKRAQILRMEDLRWAKHGKKNKVGYFLASNQIHWFFGQIQARIADLAPRKGIFVEWVKAAYTSSRCSKCGYIGKTKAERKKARQGKVFKCPKCNFQLDADLNAARNIRVAPISNNIPPSLYALGGGSPYNPPSDTSLVA